MSDMAGNAARAAVEAAGAAEIQHISMVRQNPDGTRTPLTMPNHPTLKASTLRTICSQSHISRTEFLEAYHKS
jgi:hypothetical protein